MSYLIVFNETAILSGGVLVKINQPYQNNYCTEIEPGSACVQQNGATSTCIFPGTFNSPLPRFDAGTR